MYKNFGRLLFLVAAGTVSILCLQIWWTYKGNIKNVGQNNDANLKPYERTPSLVFYNKVSKCGSSSLISTALSIAEKNGFEVHQHKVGPNPKKRPNHEDLLSEIRIISNLSRPGIYARHVYYIDFRKFGYEQPVYINMIRDPVERLVSHFYFEQVGSYGQNKTSEATYNINKCILHGEGRCTSEFYRFFTIDFFCGQDQICVNNKTKALQLAKKHIKEEYLFVGITEEFDNTLKILAKILPRFFEGAYEGWKRLESIKLQRFSTKFKHKLTEKAKKVLKKRLAFEYELYGFVKQMFEKKKQLLGL